MMMSGGSLLGSKRELFSGVEVQKLQGGVDTHASCHKAAEGLVEEVLKVTSDSNIKMMNGITGNDFSWNILEECE